MLTIEEKSNSIIGLTIEFIKSRYKLAPCNMTHHPPPLDLYFPTVCATNQKRPINRNKKKKGLPNNRLSVQIFCCLNYLQPDLSTS